MIIITIEKFVPEDITIKDDAIHKKNFGHIETWYYDAMFDNNYSMVSLTNIIHLKRLSRIITGLFIYKDNQLIKTIRTKSSIKDFYASEEKPQLILKGKHILDSKIDKKTKNWTFQISMGNKQDGVDLEFIKTVKPWKGRTYLGSWLAIPHFNVSGKIYLDGNKINVTGGGYHDHNSYPIYAPFVTKGYIFGKIPFKSMNITWANVKKNKKKNQYLIVINKDNKYISINSSDIRFTIEKEIKDQGKKIPIVWSLNVDNNQAFINIKITSLNFHHISVPSVNYWRHHVKNNGEIKIDDKSNKIDCFEIAEYLKFF